MELRGSAVETVAPAVIWDTHDGKVVFWIKAELSVAEYHAMTDKQRAERLLYLFGKELQEHFKV